MKNHPWKSLQTLVSAIAAVLIVNVVLPAHAQNEVKSTDLTQALKTFLDNMSAAQSSEQAAHSKAAELIKAADAATAQIHDTNLPPQSRFEAHAKVIELKTQAASAQLAAARQNAKLLAAAKSALHDIGHDLGSDAPEDLKGLPLQEDQPKVDVALGNLNLPDDGGIDPETVDALTAARNYYDLACRGAAQSAIGSASLQAVARRLTAWEAKNRRTIVLADAELRRLQLGALSGFSALGNYTLDQAVGPPGGLAQSSVVIGDVPLAPEICANGETPSPWPAKVSLRRALSR